ncbi:alpha-lytic protease prodomain-containing protein [Streptomyces sp. CA-250714]|uniref:alpha-lytic protease prodomain-containing protein n=1 Tax=Streptomyces sp. CA-250714 TaxID=3240060 RepID=UPI003D8E1566
MPGQFPQPSPSRSPSAAARACPKRVTRTRSKAELESIHRELAELGSIRNTAWGADPSTNQVSVETFDGAPADSRGTDRQGRRGTPRCDTHRPDQATQAFMRSPPRLRDAA